MFIAGQADVMAMAGTAIVCRCEDIRYNENAWWTSVHAASLQTRYGIGLHQARIRGTANHCLSGWSDGRASSHRRRAVARGVIPAITAPLRKDPGGYYDSFVAHCRRRR